MAASDSFSHQCGTPPSKTPPIDRASSSMAASSDHGDIKDACNGTNGGACAHPHALEAVQPRLITLDSQHGTSSSDSNGAALRLALEAARAVIACTVAVLRCSLQLAMRSWGRGSKGRISSTSFCRGRTFTVGNGGEHFNAAAAGRASCRGGRLAAALVSQRLFPVHY